jgi:hypothetical protein
LLVEIHLDVVTVSPLPLFIQEFAVGQIKLVASNASQSVPTQSVGKQVHGILRGLHRLCPSCTPPSCRSSLPWYCNSHFSPRSRSTKIQSAIPWVAGMFRYAHQLHLRYSDPPPRRTRPHSRICPRSRRMFLRVESSEYPARMPR